MRRLGSGDAPEHMPSADAAAGTSAADNQFSISFGGPLSVVRGVNALAPGRPAWFPDTAVSVKLSQARPPGLRLGSLSTFWVLLCGSFVVVVAFITNAPRPA